MNGEELQGTGRSQAMLSKLRLRQVGAGREFEVFANGVRKGSGGDGLDLLAGIASSLSTNDMLVIGYSKSNLTPAHYKFFDSLYLRCKQVQVVLRFCNEEKHQRTIDDVVFLRWQSPYDDPRSLDNSGFYVDFEFCGSGVSGFGTAVKYIENKAPKAIALLGSDYAFDRGFAAKEVPFGREAGQLEKVVHSRKIEIVELEKRVRPENGIPSAHP
jgi:hypothetical protein